MRGDIFEMTRILFSATAAFPFLAQTMHFIFLLIVQKSGLKCPQLSSSFQLTEMTQLRFSLWTLSDVLSLFLVQEDSKIRLCRTTVYITGICSDSPCLSIHIGKGNFTFTLLSLVISYIQFSHWAVSLLEDWVLFRL